MTSPKPSTFEDNVGVRIVRLADVLTRLAKIGVEEPWGLRSTDLRILNVLDGSESVAISEIARRTHVDKAWISRSVRELEMKKLVERRLDVEDSRLSLAALTDAGKALLEQMRPLARASEQRVLDGIDEKKFKQQLDKLLENAEEILGSAEALKSRMAIVAKSS